LIYKEEHSSLLDTLPVLEDNKFDIRAIPLVENDRLHSIIVRFKDIELISEEYDMGYKESISLLSEINGIPVKYIKVSIPEYKIYENSSILSFIPNYIIEPINENLPVNQFCNLCMDMYLETGDMSTVDTFLEVDKSIIERNKKIMELRRQYQDIMQNTDDPDRLSKMQGIQNQINSMRSKQSQQIAVNKQQDSQSSVNTTNTQQSQQQAGFDQQYNAPVKQEPSWLAQKFAAFKNWLTGNANNQNGDNGGFLNNLMNKVSGWFNNNQQNPIQSQPNTVQPETVKNQPNIPQSAESIKNQPNTVSGSNSIVTNSGNNNKQQTSSSAVVVNNNNKQPDTANKSTSSTVVNNSNSDSKNNN